MVQLVRNGMHLVPRKTSDFFSSLPAVVSVETWGNGSVLAVHGSIGFGLVHLIY